MFRRRIAAIVDICFEVLECRDAFVLDSLQLGRHIAIDFAVGWIVVFALSTNIFGKQILRIGIFTRAHAQHNDR